MYFVPRHANSDCSRRSSDGLGYSMDGEPSTSKRLSVACPNCRTPVLDIPAEILEIEDEREPEQVQPKRWSKRPHWISRPLNRRGSDASTVRRLENTLDLDLNGAARKRRRASISSMVSDSSSQTKVEPAPALRSILSHAPSISSGKGSTLTAKRSVKFSDEPVYYDYSYRNSHACEHSIEHASYCKLGYDCNGECIFNGYNYEYDVDMFSFEEPEEIPSAQQWGIWSRFISWLRRKSGRRTYTIEEEKRRPAISRPHALAPRTRSMSVDSAKERDSRRKLKSSRKHPPLRKVWRDCTDSG